MYLSCLLIDVGDNPDRPRPGRTWLRNLYHVHQRLCMAFPSAARKSCDPDFLKPFDPADLTADQPQQVHVQRGEQAGFLFRIDPQPAGRAVIVVQSATRPDWDYAFHNARHFLAAAPEVKTFDPLLAPGQHFRFRLLVNPTRKIDTKSGPDGRRRYGRRVPVAGIPGLLDELLSPPATAKPPRRIAQKARETRGSLPNVGPTQQRPTKAICGARRGRPVGQSSVVAESRQKVTLRLPTALIAAYRDWSWEVRSQLSHLVERGLSSA